MSAPSPAQASSFDDLAHVLVKLREWAGSPSFAEIGRRIRTLRAARGMPPGEQAPGRVTIYDCFRPGRKRLDLELVCDIVAALGAVDQIPQWRVAHAGVLRARRRAQQARGPLIAPMPAPSLPFVGRGEELAALARMPEGLKLITGMPGVGKSQLALHYAAALTETDLRLLVDLHGYDRRSDPEPPGAVLASLSRGLSQLPASAIERVVLLLDDVREEEQVRPILQAFPYAQLVVTSRRRLQLSGSELNLQPLANGKALEVITAHAPEADLDSDPVNLRRLIDSAGNLPIGLRLIADRLASHPTWTLSDQLRRLSGLPLAKPLRECLDASYAQLPHAAAELLRFLAIAPGASIALPSVVALTGWELEAVEQALSVLYAEHLVNREPSGSLTLNPVVRAYAAERGADLDPPSSRVAAMARLQGYDAPDRPTPAANGSA